MKTAARKLRFGSIVSILARESELLLFLLIASPAIAGDVIPNLPRAVVTTVVMDGHVGMELPTSKPPGISDRGIFLVDKPRSSPSGTFWSYRAFTESGASNTDEVLVVIGDTGGQTVIVEGTTSLDDGSGESVTAIGGKYGLNDTGCYAIVADSTSTSDDVIAKGCEGGPLDVIARRGDAVPNLGGPTYIGFAREPQLDNTGQVWFGFDTSEAASVNRSVFLATDSTDAVRVFQEGVTVFGDLFAGTRLLESLDIEFSSQARGGLRVSGDGMHTLLRGDFLDDTGTDDFLAFDMTVVVQEGATVAGLAAPTAANNPLASYIGATNSYFARGVNTDGTSWAMRDGTLLAKTGDVAAASTGEVFGGFVLLAPGLDGDYAIGGVTDFADDQALFYEDGTGRRPIARVGDDVDLDSDGQITLADARIQGFSTDGAVILPGDVLIASTSLCKGACASSPDFLGPALVAYDLSAGSGGGDSDVTVTKSAELIFDADASGIPFAKDVILYTVTISNAGADLDTPITYLDVTDANTILIPTATVTSKGTITRGRNRGDLVVELQLDSLASGESVTLEYRVRVNQTIDSDMICNQGEIIGLADQLLSDDPDTAEPSDPTCLPAGPGDPGNGGANGNPNPPDPLCKGLVVTIEGTNQDDFIMGTANADVIHGFRGNDMIFGMGGNDVICGGRGADEIEGGTGDDRICGQSGKDTLSGDDGDDTIVGNAGDDRLFGDAGNDRLLGGSGSDGLSGGTGTDSLFGGPDSDDLEGGDDDDRLSGGSGGDFLRGGDANDVLFGNFGDDDMHGDDGDDLVGNATGNDVAIGGVGDDFASGGPGDDLLIGRLGDDVLGGGIGADVLRGGFGRDDLQGGPNIGANPALDNDTVVGGPEDDVIEGGIGDDQLRGNQGDDDLDGGDGTDDCRGGLGTDTATDCETTQSIP